MVLPFPHAGITWWLIRGSCRIGADFGLVCEADEAVVRFLRAEPPAASAFQGALVIFLLSRDKR